MAVVPQYILDVTRPEDTIVVDTRSNSIHRFIVRRKATAEELESDPGSKYKETIGHIIDGQYVPKGTKELVDPERPYMAASGAALLILSVALPIFYLLMKAFSPKIALRIIVIACLKVIYPGATEYTMGRLYEKDYTSVLFPGAGVSKNMVGETYKTVGLAVENRRNFFGLLLSEVGKGDVIYVDGSLFQDTSCVNSFSSPSYKSSSTNCDVISVISGLSASSNLFCCEEVVPGSFSDTAGFRSFLVNNNIKQGILNGDRAFCPSIVRKVKDELNLENLHFFLRLKNNDTRIKKYNLLEVSKVLETKSGNILSTKIKVSDTEFLYAFKNPEIAYKQDAIALEKIKKEKLTYDEYLKERALYGYIFFESDIGLSEMFVYENALKRWGIEVLFQNRKRALEMDVTRVHSDFSVIGQEFINLIASNIYTLAFNKAKDAGLLEKESFKNILDDLKDVWRKISDEERNQMSINRNWIFQEGKPTSADDSWVHTTANQFALLDSLGLCTKIESKDKKSKCSSTKDLKKDPMSFDNFFSFLTSLNPSGKKLTQIFSESKVAILISILSTLETIIEKIAVGINNSIDTILNASEAQNSLAQNEIGEKSKGRGRRKGVLNVKTREKYLALKNVATSLITMKDSCMTVVANLKTYAELLVKPVKNNCSLDKNGEKQEINSKKNDKKIATKRSAINLEGSTCNQQDPKIGYNDKNKTSEVESEQTLNEAQSVHSQDNQTPGASSETLESGASVTLENAGGDLVGNDEESNEAQRAHSQDN